MDYMGNIGLAVPRLLWLPIAQHLSTKRRLGNESKNKKRGEGRGCAGFAFLDVVEILPFINSSKQPKHSGLH